MSFQKLDFSLFETPEFERDKLPERKVFTSLEEAFRFYLAWYQNFQVAPVLPWMQGHDAVRLQDRLLEQFSQDWPNIFDKASPQEQHFCVQAYVHLGGLRQAWMYADETIGTSSSGAKDNKLLRDALVARNKLLSLAEVAYEGNAAIDQQIEYIRSNTEKSRYDELTRDLIATVALFESNKFVSVNEVSYPETRLKLALELAEKLPLFSPKHNATDGTKELPINHRAFSVMAAAMYQLVGWGRFVHFPNDVSNLYLLRPVPTRTSPPQSDSPTQTDGSIPNLRPNFGT